VIAGLPFGVGRYEPYISGGFGAISIKADLFTAPAANGTRTVVSADTTRWGGNLGGGFLGYVSRFGVRGDVRYFRASGGDNFSNNRTVEENAAQAILSDLHFWRGTLGLAFRW